MYKLFGTEYILKMYAFFISTDNMAHHEGPNHYTSHRHCVVFQMTQVNKGCTLSTAELTNLGFNDHDVEFLRSNIALEKQVSIFEVLQNLSLKMSMPHNIKSFIF